MDYITYKRYKGSGIGGYFNLRHGTKETENGGFLHAPDGRGICAVTSEDGWEHFRPDTPEGAYRQKLLDKLYRFYISGKGDAAADFTAERFPDADNYYWKNLRRFVIINIEEHPSKRPAPLWKKAPGKRRYTSENAA